MKTYTPTIESPPTAERQLRVVEELPGNTRATTRPCHAVAYIQDDGEASVALSRLDDTHTLLKLAAATLHIYAARAGISPADAATIAVTGLQNSGGPEAATR